MHCCFFSLIKSAKLVKSIRFTTIFILTIAASTAKSNEDFFLYGDFIHKNNIRTVLFNQAAFELSDPLIRLNTQDRLLLRFDDLDGGYNNYHYTIIHCDAYWKPSEIQQYEYIDGFYEDQIRNYHGSMNTRVPYTHYQLEFPNHNMQPTKSGNYILKVFLDGDRDRVVFTRRFMVFEQQVSIEGHVQQANLVRYRYQKQQLEFSIQTASYHISNPYREMHLVITQNGRWDNAITNLQPRSVRGNQFVYDYEEETLFEGGNEFRRFDTRSLRQLSERVQDIQSSRRHWDVFLLPDRVRAYESYVTDNDLNGRFQVLTADGRNHMLESDYAWVHFRLPMAEPFENGHVYVMGALTDWHFTGDNRMNYNYGERAYELSLFLKQGYYNYTYAFLERDIPPARLSPVEGSHAYTENDYTIYVYHRMPGELYDRLVGIRQFNTSVPR